MGFYDELDEDTDDRPAPPKPQDHEVDGLALLRAERSAGSAHLVRWGALGARLEAMGAGGREAWAMLNLDRVMRRILASTGIEPSDVLAPLLGGVPALIGRAGELATARFLLTALLGPISADRTPEAGLANRLLTRLQPIVSDANEDTDERLAIDAVAAVAIEVTDLFTKTMKTSDPMFAVTDVLAAYGGALHDFPLDHLPSNEGASRSEMLLESFRLATSLPRPLERQLTAVPDSALLAVFDVAAGLALSRSMPPAPLLTGMIRRDLFRRDLHYPADLGGLYAALRVSLIAAERDLATIEAWRHSGQRAAGRVQLVTRAALACVGTARTSALATLAGTTWQGLRAGLASMGPALVSHQLEGWRLTDQNRGF